jgi:hypothetical protein
LGCRKGYVETETQLDFTPINWEEDNDPEKTSGHKIIFLIAIILSSHHYHTRHEAMIIWLALGRLFASIAVNLILLIMRFPRQPMVDQFLSEVKQT